MLNLVYDKLTTKLDTGEAVVLITRLKPGEGNKGKVIDKFFADDPRASDTAISQAVEGALSTGGLQLLRTDKEMLLLEPYFPKPRLIIFGGGHVAKPLAEFGAKIGLSVTVIDDRPSFANKNRFPEASAVICDSFQAAFQRVKPREADYIVIVTRGHRYDELCLRLAMKYNTAYLGMIGSKRRVKAMKDMLLEENYSPESLERVNSPIGLDIGAVTPEEIAISIIAEVISHRRKPKTTASTVKFNMPEFDEDVIHQLLSASQDPRALVTIITTKGSVPRKAGAKMLVWQDGKTLGSIGGGCSEAAVITVAQNLYESQSYVLHRVDMTGNAAEDDGMVCGGIMDVLIEVI